MDEKAFQEKLAELVHDLGDLPADEQAKVTDLANQARQRHEKMRQTIGELTESLDYLRLSVKYLVFDLEATRRENAYLRQMLDKLNAEKDAEDADEENDD